MQPNIDQSSTDTNPSTPEASTTISGKAAQQPAAHIGEETATLPKRRIRPLVAILIVTLLVSAAGTYWLTTVAKHNAKQNSYAAGTPTTKAALPTPVSADTNSLLPLASESIDPTKIPLGKDKYATSPKIGYVYSCTANYSSAAGGAQVAGPWIDTTHNTWDSTKKVAVSGTVKWPTASYEVVLSGSQRTITGNDLPINGHTTGQFPVASTDNAYSYDRNPNSIAAQSISVTMPANPTAAAQPNCLSGGAVGILSDGIVLFDALDGEGRDAAAYETLDNCDGHPEKTSEYHHHNIPSCLLAQSKTPSSSTLVGYAYDGYGIYVERDKNGNLLTNGNLDVCHGRTSTVMWDGKQTNIYHYTATLEFPYTVGCYHGSSAVKQAQTTQHQASDQTTPPPSPPKPRPPQP